MTEKYRPIYEKQAKENLEKGGRKGGLTTQNKPLSNLTNPLNSVNTNKKLADIAGVKPTTYKMGAKVLNSDNEDLKQRVLSGETSISAGYKELQNEKNEEFSFSGPYQKSFINWGNQTFDASKRVILA